MRKRLLKDGFNVVIQTLSYQEIADSISGFSWLAEKLSRLVQDLKSLPGIKNQKIFIVAHSAGGLVARYYVQTLEGYQYFDGLVTLATPHQGMWLASLGFLTHLIVKAKCLYDILPISSFVKKLNSTEFPESFMMMSIYSTHDILCPPKTTLLPPKIYKVQTVKQYELMGISHVEFLFKKKPYLLLKQWLQQQLELESKKDIQIKLKA